MLVLHKINNKRIFFKDDFHVIFLKPQISFGLLLDLDSELSSSELLLSSISGL